jgi:hypothetical protein
MTPAPREGRSTWTNELAHVAKPPLRVALLVDSYVQPRWINKILSDVQESSFARLVLIVKNGTVEERDETYSEKIHRVIKERDYLLYKLYSKLDNFLFKTQPDAFERISIEPLVADVPRLTIKPLMKKFSDDFSEEDAASIRQHGVDVALRFGFRILKGQALRIAKYGVWSYHHGDNLQYRGGPPGFWEVMNGDPSTGSILQVLTEELDDGRVIYRSFAPTDQRSVRRSTNNYFWQSSAFVERKLRDLYDMGTCALKDPRQSSWTPYSAPLYKAPKNLEMCGLLSRLAGRYLASKLQNVFTFRQWFVAFHLGSEGAGLDGTFYRFKRLMPPKDRFWADPFPLKKNGKFYIFFEELLYSTGKGHLSVMEVNKHGIVDGPHKILDRPYHLSYPFIFQWNDELYMVPETAKAGTIELYRCTSFPEQWEFDRVLLQDLRAVDSTLAEIDGEWWMFVSVDGEHTKGVYELNLYYADSPLGPWQPHECNPVRADAQFSRPAGRVVRRDGSYYRPAQIGSGYGMTIQKIERLDHEGYLEREVCRIEPCWAKGLIGTHTLNSSDGLTVIDGLIQRPRYF